MQYCFLQHWTLLPSSVTSTTGCCFCFGSVSSFFLELFLHYSPVAFGHLPTWGVHLSIFLPFHGFHGVLKARILKWLDRVPDDLWAEVRDIVQETGIKTIPIEKKCKKSKMAVWGGLTNSCEEKRSKKQRRKGKI